MHQPRSLRVTASIILCLVLQAQCADKYTDENRPYEFGFKIDGQQHRHESKDKDGIIMGEFGFITADDVYHVTVYATDKEGHFKILSMKNIHLKSSPASNLGSLTSARQGHALALPPAQAASVQASAVPQGAPTSQRTLTPQGVPIPQRSPTPQVAPPSQRTLTPQEVATPERAPTPQGAQASQGPLTPQGQKPPKPISIQAPTRTCSSCSLPTTTTRAPPSAYNQETDNNNYNSRNQFSAPESSPQNQQAFPLSTPRPLNNAQGELRGTSYSPSGGQQNYPSSQQNYPQQGPVAPAGAQTFAPQPVQTAQNYPGSPNYSQGSDAPIAPNNYAQAEAGVFTPAGQNQGGARQPAGLLQTNPNQREQNSLFSGNSNPYSGSGFSASASTVPDAGSFKQVSSQQIGLSRNNAQPTGQSSYPQGETGVRTSKQYNGPDQQFDSKLGPNGSQAPGTAVGGQRGSAKPTLVSAQMQIVDKNTDIHALRPGEQKGLPPGLTQDDVRHLLYTFNYTVGFHGHFEEGYSNGAKIGYYYVTGRNGVRTRIDYVADDSGFHPKVSQEVLDLLSEDVPKPETEKDAKYGLKGYTFKWLYYPVDSRKR